MTSQEIQGDSVSSTRMLKRVYTFVALRPGGTTEQIARELGVIRWTVQQAITRLIKQGFVRRENRRARGQKNRFHYYPVNEVDERERWTMSDLFTKIEKEHGI